MSAPVATARVRLVPRAPMDMMGGTVSSAVYLDGRWIGWVGDRREWLGHRHGGRRWWACHREDGDTAARWNSPALATRRAAVDALVEHAST